MKSFILFFLVSFSTVIFSQEKKEFKTGVKLIEKEIISKHQLPKTILFEFSGDSHLIYFYKNLSKKIKKRFKKNGIKTAFNYNLKEASLKEDIKEIPTKKHSSENYNQLCKIEIDNFKNFNNYKIKERKQKFNLDFNFIENNKIVLKGTMQVSTNNTIITENKKISKELYHLLISK
ncbi:hypothetical protein [Polaribacter cellanae]|uniref:Uncharacterized protein n=1 Tax=Polaribacter cellanae TaxID=2818493 RepID=A0A975CR10_9FLAO|nr:hypothetical protein [Polaribacter cellanae]QTE24113.1 hypothetical protein J3359_07570 [Polaribacter cellanae]